MVNLTLKFDGKIYKLEKCFPSQKQAITIAKKLRSDGYSARVHDTGKARWCVFYRKH